MAAFLPKRFHLPPSGRICIKVQNKYLRIETNQTNYLTYLIFWKGYENFEYTLIFIDLIRKISCFYDIGANIGYYSLLAAKINPDIKVVSFEPSSGPLHYLRRNIEINHLKNITVEPVALSDHDGSIEFYEIRNPKYRFIRYNLSGEGSTHQDALILLHTITSVRSTTLDRYNQYRFSENVDIIKIDTEGTEDLILRESRRILKEIRPIIICETLFDKIETELEEIFTTNDYKFYNHVPGGLAQVLTIKRTIDDGIRNCFFVPSEKQYLIAPYIVNKKSE